MFFPTYYLFEEIAGEKTYTFLDEKENFSFGMKDFVIPDDTTLAVIVNPNNPNGAVFDIKDNIAVVESHPKTLFLIDEAFIEFGGASAADLVCEYQNIVVTRTFSKAFSLAGCRIGYAIARKELIELLNGSNDAYPLARTAEAAALASLEHFDKIRQRVVVLKGLAKDFAGSLQSLGIKTYPTETYFFLGKIPYMDADAFAKALAERNIHIRPIHHERLESKFLRFATSTSENNRIVLDSIKEIFESVKQ
jgi:histidinol-phosphate aminotransferase